MGVKHLFKVLKSVSPDAISNKALSDLSGKCIGIDMSLSIYQVVLGIVATTNEGLMNRKGEDITHLYGMLQRLSIFRKHNINVIAVFDGKPTKMKATTIEKRKQQQKKNIKKSNTYKTRFQITKTIIKEVKQMLDCLCVPYIDAKTEADVMLAKLYSESIIHLIASDDSDIPVFGGMKLIRKFKSTSKTIELVDFDIFLDTMKWTQQQLIDLACLLGNDYNKNPKQIGWKRSIEGLKTFGRMKPFLESKHRTKEIITLEGTAKYYESASYDETILGVEFEFKKPDIHALRWLLNSKLNINDKKSDQMVNIWRDCIEFKLIKTTSVTQTLSDVYVHRINDIISQTCKGNLIDYKFLQNTMSHTLYDKIGVLSKITMFRNQLLEDSNSSKLYFTKCII